MPASLVKPRKSTSSSAIAMARSLLEGEEKREAQPTGFEHALDELRGVVGERFVRTDGETLENLARSTFPKGTLPCATVQPCDTREVQEIVRIAGRFGLALHPVSCGKNWGYGDACATTNGQVILDLKRMNRILEVNEELAYATIQPGVTQGQMAGYLEEHGLPLWMDATGAGPDASIVGNTVERGFGHTPNGDRFLNSCGMEIVLPDGRVVNTGFGHYENAQAAAAFKWGLGPYIDGLFTQSNFGIITKLTFWLLPKPECFEAFFFSVRKEEDLGLLVEALRPLRMNGTLKTAVHIFNDLRLISGAQDYPWKEMKGETPLSQDMIERLKKKHGVEAWSGSGALYGSKEEVAAARRVIKKALKDVPGLSMLVFVNDRRMRLAEWCVSVLACLGIGSSLRQLFRKLKIGYELLKGRSSNECLQGARWRVRPMEERGAPDALDPLDHNAGFYWISPVLPMTRAHVDRFRAVVKPIFARHGFEYQVTMSMVTARALCAVTTISFDKTNLDEVRRARICHDEVWKAVMHAGYIPYRAGNAAMPGLDTGSSVYWDVIAQLKRAMDPNGIVAPGHYEPRRAKTDIVH